MVSRHPACRSCHRTLSGSVQRPDHPFGNSLAQFFVCLAACCSRRGLPAPQSYLRSVNDIINPVSSSRRLDRGANATRHAWSNYGSEVDDGPTHINSRRGIASSLDVVVGALRAHHHVGDVPQRLDNLTARVSVLQRIVPDVRVAVPALRVGEVSARVIAGSMVVNRPRSARK